MGIYSTSLGAGISERSIRADGAIIRDTPLSWTVAVGGNMPCELPGTCPDCGKWPEIADPRDFADLCDCPCEIHDDKYKRDCGCYEWRDGAWKELPEPKP